MFPTLPCTDAKKVPVALYASLEEIPGWCMVMRHDGTVHVVWGGMKIRV